MASLKTIKGKGGDSYKVEWRTGTDPATGKVLWASETFNPQKDPARDRTAAEAFRDAVERAGGWPDYYAPGYGYLTPEQYLARERAVQAAAPQNDPSVPALTLDGFAPGHIDSLTDVEAATKTRYQQVYRDRVHPYFGALDLSDDEAPTAREARTWINALIEGEKNPDYDPDAEDPDTCPEWLREPCSAKTVRNTHSVVSLLYKAAVAEKLRHANPFYGLKLPSPEDDGEGDEEMTYLAPDEFAVLLDAMDLDARPLTEVLAGTGLRFGEATALKVKDLHLDDPAPHLRVWRAWKQGGRLGTTKTRKGKRRIALTPDQVAMLRRVTTGRERDRNAFV